MKLLSILLAALLPTFAYARWQKRKRDRAGRAIFIQRMNSAYLAGGIVLAVGAFGLSSRGIGDPPWRTWWPLLSVVV
jgi:ribosomal protein L20